MSQSDNPKLAVLIDADNAQAAILPALLAEIAKFGTSSVKRAYGNWTTPNLQSWKADLLKHAIQPIQQFNYTTGKNATDSALIIDAMDLLYSGNLDGFCIVSSDSDFTRLATRIREAGLLVYGFGEEKTPEPFRAACDKFVYTEILQPKNKKKTIDPKKTGALQSTLTKAIQASSKDDGWVSLSALGSYITKSDPSFDQRNYGFEKLGELVKAQKYLKTEDRQAGDGSSGKNVFVRLKD